jgi:hypothetical protein
MPNVPEKLFIESCLHYTTPSPVSLKMLHCVLFLFFNRATRLLRGGSVLATHLDLAETAVLPLVASAVLHTAFLCPGFVAPTRTGWMGHGALLRSLLHMLLLHALAGLLVAGALRRYANIASFLAVILASHLIFSVRPRYNLVPAQALLYGRLMVVASYAIPLLSWLVLPVLRVHELEAIVLLYVPEALCYAFEWTLRFGTLLLQMVVDTTCCMCGV